MSTDPQICTSDICLRLRSCNMTGGAYKQIIHSCLDEVTSEYMSAAKQAITDYVLKSPVEQRRLGLQALRPILAQKQAALMGKARVANWDLPDWWHQSVATSREEIAWTLQTLSANTLELNELWVMQGFSSRFGTCSLSVMCCCSFYFQGVLNAPGNGITSRMLCTTNMPGRRPFVTLRKRAPTPGSQASLRLHCNLSALKIPQQYTYIALAHAGWYIDAVYRLLLDVSSAEFKGAQPIEVDAFKTWQAECTERGKAGLWTSWLPKCVEVFRRLLPIFINGNSDAYYSSIATLQVLLVCRATSRFADIHVLHADTHYAEALQPVLTIAN